ncbi:MAG: hypothetical protein ACFFFB_03675 [Candidatus Heimdallarchaeota archaeon]
MIFIKNNNTSFEKLEIVKKYFARIFIVLKKEIRRELLSLDLTKEELKEIKKELVFLPEDKQKEYLKELSNK